MSILHYKQLKFYKKKIKVTLFNKVWETFYIGWGVGVTPISSKGLCCASYHVGLMEFRFAKIQCQV